jgi:hypothetical protein
MPAIPSTYKNAVATKEKNTKLLKLTINFPSRMKEKWSCRQLCQVLKIFPTPPEPFHHTILLSSSKFTLVMKHEN